jgi:hypothetical protein
MSLHRSIRYDRLLQVRVPGFLSAALDVAARRRGSKPSEYLRRRDHPITLSKATRDAKTSATTPAKVMAR